MINVVNVPGPLRVLHLEDHPRDAEIVKDHLESCAPALDVVHAIDRVSYETALGDGAYDIIVCDFSVPGFDGFAALRMAKAKQPYVPVIVVSGVIDPVAAVQCLHEGAVDYLLKERLERLPSAVARALDDLEQRRRHQALSAKLRESEERFRRLAEDSRDGYWFFATDPARVVFVNPAVERIWGASAATFYEDETAWLDAVHPADRQRVAAAWDAWAGGEVDIFDHEFRVVRPDGAIRRVGHTGTRILDDEGCIARLSVLTRDTTEQRKLEEQVHDIQRMESIARLAGGIAGEFDSLLTIINGAADCAKAGLPADDAHRSHLEEIRAAGERAAMLTRRLLAFSGRQVLQPRLLDLSSIVRGAAGGVRRLIGDAVHLVLDLAEDLGPIQADPIQLEQVIIDLAINARDAMPRGGTLTLQTSEVVLDDRAEATKMPVPPGPYVVLCASDEGVGMDENTSSWLFEPFFTTKAPGSSAGLGLAMVYGVVAQSGGTISMNTAAGTGTVVRIYLPCVRHAGATAAHPRIPAICRPASSVSNCA